MKHSLQLLVGVVLLGFSCQKELTDDAPATTPSKKGKSTLSAPKDQLEYILPEEQPNKDENPNTGSGGITVVLTPPTSPTMNNASPFIKSGKASGSFCSTGDLNSVTTDFIAFGPAEQAVNFPFVPPTGAAKLWMGFIIRGNGGTYYNVRGYPFAVSNGNAYWSAGPVNTQLIAGTLNGTPMNYKWVPAEWDSQSGFLKHSGYWSCTNCGTVATTTADVTVSLIKISPDDRLTLKATVKIGGTTYTINRVDFKRLN